MMKKIFTILLLSLVSVGARAVSCDVPRAALESTVRSRRALVDVACGARRGRVHPNSVPSQITLTIYPGRKVRTLAVTCENRPCSLADISGRRFDDATLGRLRGIDPNLISVDVKSVDLPPTTDLFDDQNEATLTVSGAEGGGGRFIGGRGNLPLANDPRAPVPYSLERSEEPIPVGMLVNCRYVSIVESSLPGVPKVFPMPGASALGCGPQYICVARTECTLAAEGRKVISNAVCTGTANKECPSAQECVDSPAVKLRRVPGDLEE